MTDTPEDWVLIEAARKCGATTTHDRDTYLSWCAAASFRALCDMIAKHQQKPVDRKLLCAEEANREYRKREQEWDSIDCCVHAIELWEEGFGK
jgi:hypothetical protein